MKHELVEMLRGLDNARSLMYYAGWAAQDKPDEFALAASAFRLAAGKAFDHAARVQISVHGGIGATWEHDAPLYFRRAQLSRRLLGGTAGAADRVAGELLTAARLRARRGRRLAATGEPAHDRQQQRAWERAGRRASSHGSTGRVSRVRRPATIASIPRVRRRPAAAKRNSGSASSSSRASALSPNSVCVKPGQRHVTLTPVPPSSACTASENDCTNALLAA